MGTTHVTTSMHMRDGRVLGVHGKPALGLTVFWHHGTPGSGAPPPVTLPRPDLAWAGVDRPGYGRSDRLPGRTPRDVAHDVAEVADAWGLESYAVVGYSGGGPHALACAAADARVAWVITVASLAPRDGAADDWYAGMIPSGVATLRAAEAGEAQRRGQSDDDYDPEFLRNDLEALHSSLGWLGAAAGGADGPVDDDLAYVRPWGVDLRAISCPVTLVHGDADRIVPVHHGRRLASLIRTATLVELPGEGHVSALRELDGALESGGGVTQT